MQIPATSDALDGPDERSGTPRDASAEDVIAPTSFAQQRLWLLERLFPTRSVYNEGRLFRLVGCLDVVGLEAALNAVVARHESLRTRFALQEGGPVQVIASELRLALAVEDLGGLPVEEREAEALRRAQEEAQAPFDLEHGPLVRARLLRLGENDHWLLLTLHHIITDGWSSAVLLRELSTLYGLHGRGEASGLPALPVQYADYAVWQRESMQGEVLEQQVGYWKSVLAELPVLELPTDRPRPAIASFRGGQVHFGIDKALTRGLKALGQAERATLFMTLLAAFQVLLHRYSGQDDIAVGVPIAGRTQVELEGLIGFFVNTLVLRADLSGDPSFREHLARVRSRALDAYAHQDVPFEKLVEELRPKRDLSRNPLFQVALMLRNMPRADLVLAGLEVQRLEGVLSRSAKFDLAISVTETGGGLAIAADFAIELFDAATIERMVRHWQVMLEGIVADPEQALSRLPLVPPEERRQLLVEWNATAVDYPRERCVHELVEAQVERTPEAVAVVFGERQLTYAELNRRANQLAHHLRTLGVGPEVPVGVCVERSLDLVVGLLGILKSGGAYVPLDPGYPGQRLAFMVGDTQAPVVVTQERLLGMLPGEVGRVLCLDRDAALIANSPATNPPAIASAANLAYVIYTSGSTGTPKGVMIEHRNVVNHLVSMLRRFAPDGDDCVLQPTPIGFDQSIWQMLYALVSGGRAALLEPGSDRSVDEIAEAIRRHGVTILRIVPTMLEMLLRGPGLGRCPSLRLVIAGGDILEGGVAAAFAAQSRALLVNGYGPTETTFVSTLWECDGATAGRSVPIGMPIGNVRAYVLDRNDQPVPVGVRGELCLAGAGVGRGYWRRSELTARSFVPDPFASESSARMYRTGDLARQRPDGVLEFLGRSDFQVQLRGARIELGEIEAALARHDDVTGAVVIARDIGADDRRLVAYYTARCDPPPAARELRALLKANLPEFMIPAAFVCLHRFPVTPNGKIDRLRLPAPDSRSLAAHAMYVAPRNPVEARLAAIFGALLGFEKVGADDDFFALGGHSLLAMRLLADVRAQFATTVRLHDFFGGATVAGLASLLERGVAAADASGTTVPPRGREGPQVPRNPRMAADASGIPSK